MKKLLLLTIPLFTLLFASCEKSDDNAAESTEFTLSITPSKAKVGEVVTLKISGEGAEEKQWSVCYDYEGGGGSCLIFAPGNATQDLTLSETIFIAGEYDFHAKYTNEGEEIEINHVTLTVTE
ncbi:MAG: hypothetical protein R3Y08_00210 [Rikenellaceae bacterium]